MATRNSQAFERAAPVPLSGTGPDPLKHLLGEVLGSGRVPDDPTHMPADRLVIASEERFESAHIASPNLADHFALVLHHARSIC